MNAKLVCFEAKFTLVELGKLRQYSWEDLDAYMKRFHKKTLNCDNLVAEDVLVNVCLEGMIEDYWIYLGIFRISLSRLIEVARRTNKSVRKTWRSSSLIRSRLKKRPIIIVVGKNKGAKASYS